MAKENDLDNELEALYKWRVATVRTLVHEKPYPYTIAISDKDGYKIVLTDPDNHIKIDLLSAGAFGNTLSSSTRVCVGSPRQKAGSLEIDMLRLAELKRKRDILIQNGLLEGVKGDYEDREYAFYVGTDKGEDLENLLEFIEGLNDKGTKNLKLKNVQGITKRGYSSD